MTADDEAEVLIEAAKQSYLRGEIDAAGLDRAVGAALRDPPAPRPWEGPPDNGYTLEAYPPRGPLPDHLVEAVKPTKRKRARKPEWYDAYAAWRAEQPD